MDTFTLLLLLAVGTFILKTKDQKRRIALLGRRLATYQIEKLMETLTDGYLRALGEKNPERRAQVWSLLGTAEAELDVQFQRFVAEMSKLDAAQVRMSKLHIAIPYIDRLFPGLTLDLRQVLHIHAQGIGRAVANVDQLSEKDRAFTLCAELFLMQHTCHWYCRSQAVASARLLARHKTPYAKVLASVAPATRAAYIAWQK